MVLSFFQHFAFYILIMIKNYFFLIRFLVPREWRVAAPTALAIVSSRQPISVGSVCKRSDVASNVRVQISVGQRTGSNQSAPSNKLLVRQSHASTTGKMWLIYGQSSIHSTTLHWITILETNWKPLLQEEAVTSCGNAKAVKPLKVLQFKVRINMKLPFARRIFLNIGNLPAFFWTN